MWEGLKECIVPVYNGANGVLGCLRYTEMAYSVRLVVFYFIKGVMLFGCILCG